MGGENLGTLVFLGLILWVVLLPVIGVGFVGHGLVDLVRGRGLWNKHTSKWLDWRWVVKTRWWQENLEGEK